MERGSGGDITGYTNIIHCLNHNWVWFFNTMTSVNCSRDSFYVWVWLLTLESESGGGTGSNLGSPSVSWSRCSLSSISCVGPPPPSPKPKSRALWLTLPLSLLFLTVFTSCQHKKPLLNRNCFIHSHNNRRCWRTTTLTSFTLPLISYESPGGK